VLNGQNEMGGTCGTKGAQMSCLKRFVGKPQRKKPRGKLNNRWEVSTNTAIQYMESEDCELD
jgi:hypothetical protein